MSTREKDRAKQIQDKCQNLLNSMLRDEDNKYCVDCDAKGPRWASWNIGIFLCIRCAGIHRNLGVHISKVKSVNLDSWTPEQVVSLQQMGNSRARAVYEANLPDSFRRPQTDSALESFIRNKYELKKYIAVEWVPPSLPKVDWDRELDEEAEKAKKKRKTPVSANKPGSGVVPLAKKENSVVPPPLPKPSSSPKQHHRGTVANTGSAGGTVNSSSPAQSSKVNSSNASADLLGLDSFENSTSSQNNEDFTSFLSAPVAASTASAKRSEDEESFFNQALPQPQQEKKLTKDSILALYAKTPSFQGMPGVPPANQFLVAGPQPPPNQPLYAAQAAGVSQPQPLPTAFLPYQQQTLGHPPQSFSNLAASQHSIAPGQSSNPFYNMSATQLAQDFATVRLQPNPTGLTVQPPQQAFQPTSGASGAAAANLWQ